MILCVYIYISIIMCIYIYIYIYTCVFCSTTQQYEPNAQSFWGISQDPLPVARHAALPSPAAGRAAVVAAMAEPGAAFCGEDLMGLMG